MNNKHSEQWSLVGLGITIVVLVLLVIFVDISSLIAWVERAGAWGPFIFIILKISTIVIAPLSGSPLYPIVGLLFGFWPGILYIAIGDITGCSINFHVSRLLGREKILRWLSGKEESLLAKIINHVSDTRGFLHACMTFFAMPELLSYGAGLSRLPFIKFITIAPPFLVIPSIILVYFGSILAPGGKSILLSFGIPIMGTIALLIGSAIFLKKLSKEK